jgi:hypothetical protein
MSLLSRFSSRAWILAPVCALTFVLWSDCVRLRHVELVSSIAGEDARIDPGSPTGYADGKRWLIVPEHHNPTYQWIEETQLMLARGDWRVRGVEYENAPFGREVHAASPYRWWLVLVAWVEHALAKQPLGLCVERAALFADPLLHLLLLAAATIFVALRFGPFCAAMFSAGLAAIFPLASAFLPGVADDFGLVQICSLASVLLLVAGTMARQRASPWYFAAGVAGGCGLWLSAMGEVPIIAGIAGGGILAGLMARGSPTGPPVGPSAPPPWRAWAFGGAVSSLLGYLIEYFPGHMEPQLRVNYPLYGLAWLGLGELLWRFASWMRGERPLGGVRGAGILILSTAAVASLPVAISWSGVRVFLADDLLSARLTNLPDPAVAGDLSAWIGRNGPGGAFAAAFLPVLLLGPAAWFLFRGRTGAVHRAAIAIAAGPVLAAFALSIRHPRWWNTFDAVLLVLLVAAAAAVHTATNPRRSRWLWSALLGMILAFSLVHLVPAGGAGESGKLRLTLSEVEGLYERGLAQWIADHAGPDGATVLVPPFRTSSFCFYGGLRGLGTQNWENGDGMSATFYIVTAMRQGESLSAIRQRGVTYIVLPSWDTDFDDLARLRLKDPAASFVYALHNTNGGGFSWLRALPYKLPPVGSLEEQSVMVLEVTDETDTATQQSRFVEYLVETHQDEQAALASQALLRYPSNLGSLAALAQLAIARGDEGAFAKAFKSIVSNLASRSGQGLAWDRRVSLAVVLALGGRADLSREQVNRCFREANEAHIRFLTTESLYHLLLLGRRAGMEISDPKLRALSLKLLPEKLRERL